MNTRNWRRINCFWCAAVILLGSAPLLLRAQSDGADAKAGDSTMRVAVLGEDGRPIPGATVHITVWTKTAASRQPVQTCNEKGEVIVSRAQAHTLVRVWAEHPEYVGMCAQWWPELQKDGGILPNEYTFRLAKGTVIGGVVKNDRGKPIAGARVQVDLAKGIGQGAGPRLMKNPSLAFGESACVTDAAGRWRLANVPAKDDVLVSLSHPDYVSDYRLGTLQSEQAVNMEMLRKETAAIVMHGGVIVSGTVRDANEKPIESAVVIWGDAPYITPGSHEVSTDSKGYYRFPPLPEGELAFTAVAPGWAPDQQKLKLTGDTELNFPLNRGKTMRFKFQDEKGVPLPKVYVGIARWREGQALYTTKHPNVIELGIPREADESGIYEWTWAPEDPIMFHFTKEGYKELFNRKFVADDAEHVIEMRPK